MSLDKEPDDLPQARQEPEALLTQIQPEPYKFLVELSRQTNPQKTLRSGGDIDLAARLVDEQARRFGEPIQVILDRITYPTEAEAASDLVGRETSEGH